MLVVVVLVVVLQFFLVGGSDVVLAVDIIVSCCCGFLYLYLSFSIRPEKEPERKLKNESKKDTYGTIGQKTISWLNIGPYKALNSGLEALIRTKSIYHLMKIIKVIRVFNTGQI